jgi:hypothetical protein
MNGRPERREVAAVIVMYMCYSQESQVVYFLGLIRYCSQARLSHAYTYRPHDPAQPCGSQRGGLSALRYYSHIRAYSELANMYSHDATNSHRLQTRWAGPWTLTKFQRDPMHTGLIGHERG